MRDYIPKNFSLPRFVYYQAIYAIKDYDRMLRSYEEMIAKIGGKRIDDLPVSNGDLHSHVERVAEKIDTLHDKITAIDRAFSGIPHEYREAIFNNIRFGTRYPYTASTGTWSRWRRIVIYLTAKYLRLL